MLFSQMSCFLTVDPVVIFVWNRHSSIAVHCEAQDLFELKALPLCAAT